MRTFASEKRQTTPFSPSTMSKVRIPVNPKQVGKVGAYTMYVRGGEQIVRQRQNASNYGESASRTLAQQTRRARWGNLVNVYKSLKFWQAKAWESLKEGVTDYNAFMSTNINSTPIYLTKDMVANGCAVMDNFIVSKGSIAPIDGTWVAADQAFTTNIVTSSAVSASTTIAQLSKDIIANNSTFKDGDNIAYIRFEQQSDDRQYPYLQSLYEEFTLNTQNGALLSTLPIFSLIKTDNPNNLFFAMEASSGWNSVGAVAIHTRRDNGLKVSTQQMVVVDTSLIGQFSGEAARSAAIDSYGVSSDVPLEPSFSEASIASVIGNGRPILPGGVYSSAVDLKVTGKGMNSSSVKLYKDDEYFTPLSVNGDEWMYILGQVGRYRLYVNGSLYVDFRVDSIDIPSNLTGYVLGALLAREGSSVDPAETNSYTLNYGRLVSDSNPSLYLVLRFKGKETLSFDSLESENATGFGGEIAEDQTDMRRGFTPIDPTEPVVIRYKGFIVFVANYSA